MLLVSIIGIKMGVATFGPGFLVKREALGTEKMDTKSNLS